jgi:glycosyltransferase involved in cell wall biosynthesis
LTEYVRVALVLPGLGSGGLERIVRTLALALPSRRYEPAVFCTTKLGVHAGEIRKAGIPVWRCRDPIVRVPGLPARLIVRLAQFAPALVHAHGGAWRPAAVACAVLRTPRLVYTEHGRVPHASKWSTTIERWCSRRTACVTTVSSALAAELRRSLDLPAEPQVIANGVEAPTPDGRGRESLRRGLGVLPGQVLGVTVGRLERAKDHALLLRAYSSIAAEIPQLHLALVGAGSLESDLRAQADRLGLAARTSFAGHQNDVTDWLRAADFFVLSSESEGLPLALLEAMAQGLPVVATAVGGIPEVLHGSHAGLLVPPGDAGALGRAMAQLARDRILSREMGLRARERSGSYSLGGMIDRYCAVYESVLGGRARSA